MSLTHREDSITGIRQREAQKTKIATSATLVDGSIVLELPEGGICTGTMVKFKSPCNCIEVTNGLTINGRTFAIVDAAKDVITGKGGFWTVNAKLSVVLDCESGHAYLQNTVAAKTIAKLNSHTQDKNNPHGVHATQVPTSEDCATLLDIQSNPNVDEALKALWLLFNMVDLRFKGSDGKFIWNMYRQGVTVQGTTELSGETTYHDYGSDDYSAYMQISVSDDVEIVDGVIKQVNPFTVYIESNEAGIIGCRRGYDAINQSSLVGKYVSYKDSAVYRFTSSTIIDAEWNRHGNSGGTMFDLAWIEITSLGICVVAKNYVGNVESENENAYPDNEWAGDVYYVKINAELGIPNIVNGSYTGLNAYGSASKNGLAFPFVPEMVVIQSETTDKSVTLLHGCTNIGGLTVSWNDDTKSVSWYASSAENQLNSAIKYRYFAIGKGAWV